MRCYFIKKGRVTKVEELNGLSDAEAIETARALFEESGDDIDGVEVWDRMRRVKRFGSSARRQPAKDGAGRNR
jgi:hypothetical protein